MRQVRQRLRDPKSVVLPVITAALAMLIFAADTTTDLEIAVAVFYVAIVLLSVNFLQARGVVLVAAGCVVLTLLSYALTPTGVAQSGLINCFISISAIAMTTYLVLKIESAKIALHEARAQLEHVARVTTLGELAASIAHEVNQPLAAVVTSGNACLRWLATEPANIEKARQSVERMVNDANRASDIVERVRNLAKGAPALKGWFSVNDVIREVVSLTQNEIEQNDIRLDLQLADELPPVLGSRVGLQQVILNLILNAIEALHAVRDGDRELVISTAKDPVGRLHVAVRDTGVGLDAGKVDALFDAFYSTKHDGMGLGLTISRSIIEGHGGRLWAAANAPRGAIVQFSIPIEEEAGS